MGLWQCVDDYLRDLGTVEGFRVWGVDGNCFRWGCRISASFAVAFDFYR